MCSSLADERSLATHKICQGDMNLRAHHSDSARYAIIVMLFEAKTLRPAAF